jgi:hypothetical protein
MKKNIFKSLTCILLLTLAWSCSTENDVQMQPSDSQIQLKDGGLLDGVIGEDLGNGVYRITVDETQLLEEIERISVEDGNPPAKFQFVEIAKRTAANNPQVEGIVLLAGTGHSSESDAITISFNLETTPFGLALVNPAAPGGGGSRTSCRGCGTGCFLDYYEIDGHFLAYCDAAGCGWNCTRTVIKK